MAVSTVMMVCITIFQISFFSIGKRFKIQGSIFHPQIAQITQINKFKI